MDGEGPQLGLLSFLRVSFRGVKVHFHAFRQTMSFAAER
ncbi:hypothetical protein IFM89_031664 [Coptis chinensis]|uniref:Uncharacterized protein n=1 Tax=Coptis chinensis TaxID=261450 RepID=A0A835ISX0_9MAGN|nr:hypothetical protein IFM89_031664 [Coptis chinensis]